MASGEVVVWGDDTYNQITKRPKSKDYEWLAQGGATQSLAVRADGTFALWGTGEIPDPSASVLPGTGGVPTVLDASIPLTYLVAISKADGSLKHWGDYVPALGPVVTPSGTDFQRVAGGGGFGVAIDKNNKLKPWGTLKVAPKGEFSKVRARNDYVIALHVDGRLFGWGGGLFSDKVYSFNGKLKTLAAVYLADWDRDADGFLCVRPKPGKFPEPASFVDIAAGAVQKDLTVWTPHVLALDDVGNVRGWGANTFGERIPPSGVSFIQIAAGLGFSIGLDKKHKLHHWGKAVIYPDRAFLKTKRPLYGRLDVVPKGRFTSIGAGTHHAVAVREPR